MVDNRIVAESRFVRQHDEGKRVVFEETLEFVRKRVPSLVSFVFAAEAL